MWRVILLLAILMLATVIGLGVIYYVDSVAVPAWNEHAVPPPTLD
jgi:hypothetical protein